MLSVAILQIQYCTDFTYYIYTAVQQCFIQVQRWLQCANGYHLGTLFRI